MADAEIGVMLEPRNDLQDEVDDVTVGASGDGGGMSASQQQEQESILAGGVSKGLAAAGIIGAVLTQLKSVTGIIEAVFGFLSRALLPAVEVIAELIRPFISGINDFIADPVGAISDVANNETVQREARRQQENLGPALTGFTTGSPASAIGRLGSEVLLDNFTGLGGPGKPDQTDEAGKNQLKNNIDDAQRDKTGNFR